MILDGLMLKAKILETAKEKIRNENLHLTLAIIQVGDNLASNVYIKKTDYTFPGTLDSDLIGLNVYDKTKYKGKIIGIEKSPLYSLLIIDGVKKHLIPNTDKFIKEIDLNSKKIYINYIKGLDNEN